jgi:hypothetical protein
MNLLVGVGDAGVVGGRCWEVRMVDYLVRWIVVLIPMSTWTLPSQ